MCALLLVLVLLLVPVLLELVLVLVLRVVLSSLPSSQPTKITSWHCNQDRARGIAKGYDPDEDLIP